LDSEDDTAGRGKDDQAEVDDMEGGDNQQGEHDARTGDICLVEPGLFNPTTYMKRI